MRARNWKADQYLEEYEDYPIAMHRLNDGVISEKELVKSITKWIARSPLFPALK